MKRLFAIVCVSVCLSAPRAAQAEVLFDLDPNVADVLSLEYSHSPTPPAGVPPATWEDLAQSGYEWTTATLRPNPAGRLTPDLVEISSVSSVPIKLDLWYPNGVSGGPPYMVLSGTPIRFENLALSIGDSVSLLNIVFLSNQSNPDGIQINSLRVEGTARIIPEPSTVVVSGVFLLVLLRIAASRRRITTRH
jgi:hypothetical protein